MPLQMSNSKVLDNNEKDYERIADSEIKRTVLIIQKVITTDYLIFCLCYLVCIFQQFTTSLYTKINAHSRLYAGL